MTWYGGCRLGRSACFDAARLLQRFGNGGWLWFLRHGFRTVPSSCPGLTDGRNGCQPLYWARFCRRTVHNQHSVEDSYGRPSTNTWIPTPPGSRRNCANSCGFPASAPIPAAGTTCTGRPNGWPTSSAAWACRRGDPHGRASAGLRRVAGRARRPDGPGLRPLRRAAARSAGEVDFPPFEPTRATATSTPAAPPTTRARCSPT